MTWLLRLDVSMPCRGLRSRSTRSGNSGASRAATASPTTPAPTTVRPVSVIGAPPASRPYATLPAGGRGGWDQSDEQRSSEGILASDEPSQGDRDGGAADFDVAASASSASGAFFAGRAGRAL